MDDLIRVFSVRSISCDAYHNVFNGVTFNHDFEIGGNLKETYPVVKEKYDRRIKRLLDRIDRASSVLGVFVESPDSGKSKLCKRDLRDIRAKLQNAFPNKRFDLLYVSPDADLKHGSIVTALSENGLVWIVSEYKCQKPDAPSYTPDMRVLRKILKKYRLNLPLAFKIKRRLQRLFVSLIPVPFIRKKMKRKYKF